MLGEHSRVTIDRKHHPQGLTAVRMLNVTDVVPFLMKVQQGRTVSATKMNEGSSRSHASLILTLRQLNRKTKKYVETEMHCVDLAGAERPE